MKTYTTLVPVLLPAGTELQLNEKQAAVRMHLLKKTARKGVYTATGELAFKAGEIIGLQETLSKAVLPSLAEVSTGEDKA
jgi:hypothetical protein